MRLAPNPIAFGAALLVMAMALIGLIDNFVRFIADEAGLWQFHVLRAAMALPLLALVLWLAGLRMRPRNVGAVAARSVANATSMLLYFGALPMVPIAQVGAALFTAPIWVLVFGWLFFGRPIGPWRVAAVAIGFAGVLIMLRPDPANIGFATLMPVAAGALYGLANLLTREWCAGEPVGAMLAGGILAISGISLVALVLVTIFAPVPDAAPFLLSGWQPVTGALIFWTAIQAVGSLVGVAMLVRAYQSGETSYLAVFEYSFLIFAGYFAWLIWGETMDRWALLGMAMIAASGTIVALREGRARRRMADAGSEPQRS